MAPSAGHGAGPLTAHVPPGEAGGISLRAAWYWMWFVMLGTFARAAIIAFWIFGSRLGDAFDTWLVPVLGFLVAPATIVTYALMWGTSSHAVTGAEWLFVAFGVLVDLMAWGSLQRALEG